MDAPTAIHPERINELRTLWKKSLADIKELLTVEADKHRLGLRQVEPLLKSHRLAVDKALINLWAELHMPKELALIAVGGYGRGELFPYSDVDVLVLVPGEIDADLQERLEAFFGLGWDIGLEVGHSVRTLYECLSEAAKDITVQTALLEARLVAGSKPAFIQLASECKKQLDPAQFFTAKVLELKQRHARFQDTPYALEPNCKDSPGGIRDLHVLMWIAKAASLGNSWAEMAKRGLITPHEAKQIRRNERILKSLRLHLHWHSRRREDRLVFDVQTALAQRLGFEPTDARRASEFMMQRYYWAAKAVLQLTTILLQNIETMLFKRDLETPTLIDDDFQARGQLLDLRDDEVFKRNPSAMLRAFIVMQQHSELNGMSARLLRALWHERFRIDASFRNNPHNRQLFVEFLKQPRGIVHEFRRMNQTSVLGRYLPEFRKIIGQMQHDLFHVYTVDQHIMTVLRNIRRFTMPEHAHEYPFCSQLMANFDEPWILYVAALYHDIAKGRGGDHSTLGAVDARRFCKRHFMSKEDTELVAFLVEHHLTMSNTAQKQDLSDPDTIVQFAQMVKTERNLTALYLLTVADVRGTSPKVWNAWKGKLLEDLYKLTLRALGGSVPNKGQQLQDRQEDAKRILRLYTLADDAHENLWKNLDIAYFLRTEAGDISWHTRQLFWRVDSDKPIVKGRLSPIGEGLQILVYCPDQPDLFARICGYFDSKNLSILDAKIHTTKKGYALDSFMVSDSGQEEFYRELISLIESELTQRLVDKTPLGPPAKGRLSRQSRHFPIIPAVDLRQDEKGQYYLLSLSATDRTGLLYSVARVLAHHRVNLHTAKVMTLGERVEDTFLVDGPMLSSGKAQIQLETELLEALNSQQ